MITIIVECMFEVHPEVGRDVFGEEIVDEATNLDNSSNII